MILLGKFNNCRSHDINSILRYNVHLLFILYSLIHSFSFSAFFLSLFSYEQLFSLYFLLFSSFPHPSFLSLSYIYHSFVSYINSYIEFHFMLFSLCYLKMKAGIYLFSTILMLSSSNINRLPESKKKNLSVRNCHLCVSISERATSLVSI